MPHIGISLGKHRIQTQTNLVVMNNYVIYGLYMRCDRYACVWNPVNKKTYVSICLMPLVPYVEYGCWKLVNTTIINIEGIFCGSARGGLGISTLGYSYAHRVSSCRSRTHGDRSWVGIVMALKCMQLILWEASKQIKLLASFDNVNAGYAQIHGYFTRIIEINSLQYFLIVP